MDYLETIKPVFLVLYYLFVSVIIILIILDNKKPEKSFAFIFLILLIPVAGLVIYLLFGAQYQKKKLFTKKRYFDKVYLDRINARSRANRINTVDESESKLPTLFYNIEQVSFSRCNEIEILNNGEEKFPKLIEAIEGACENIHLEYYIIKESSIGQTLIDLLCKRSDEGLTVRVIYDDVGSSISRANLSRLEKHGVSCHAYMPVLFSRLAHKANYRNHRKIAIIDNEIGFLGGININDKYINPSATGLYWRDTHLLIRGEAVVDLQYLFISDWYFVSGEKIDLAEVEFKNRFAIDKGVAISILGSDYGKYNQTIMEAFFGMMRSARDEILITTPYFIPNDSILNALRIAAKCGVSIKIILPERPDIKTAFYASQTYFKDLLRSGVEIYYYAKGMMHSKTMIVDSSISTVGSTNMDQRSFSLNAEVNAFIMDREFATKLRSHFIRDLEDSYLLTLEMLKNRPWYIKVLCSAARLMAPIL